MLLAIGVIIASMSVLTTFVVNLASAQNATTQSWIGKVGNITDIQNGTNKTKPSESLTMGGGLSSEQGNLEVACSLRPEQC
jgi:hypothetical protein